MMPAMCSISPSSRCFNSSIMLSPLLMRAGYSEARMGGLYHPLPHNGLLERRCATVVRCATLGPRFGVWRSSEARLHGVQEALGSNPSTPTILPPFHRSPLHLTKRRSAGIEDLTARA